MLMFFVSLGMSLVTVTSSLSTLFCMPYENKIINFILFFFQLSGVILFSSMIFYAEQSKERFDKASDEWVYTEDNSTR